MSDKLVTKQRAKLINTAIDIQTQTPQEAHSIGFTTKSLAIANLPYHDIKKNRWTRKNGNFTFTVVAMKEGVKIPFGVIPRLFFIWLMTEIIRTRSRVIILGNHFDDFLEKLGYNEDGGYTRKRVKEQIERLYNAAIGTYYDDKNVTVAVVPETIVEKYSIWKTKKTHSAQQELFPNTIEVRESFYDEIIKSKVPIDMRIVEGLKNSAMKLDIYIWLTYRMWNVEEPQKIKYEDMLCQFGNDFGEKRKKIEDEIDSATDPQQKNILMKKLKKNETIDLNNFRTKFRAALKDVLKLYSAAKVDTKSSIFLTLYPSPTSVPKIPNKTSQTK